MTDLHKYNSFGALIPAIALAALLAAAPIRADECERLPPPSVTLKRLDEPLSLDTSYGYKSITALASTLNRAEKRVLGLTRGTARSPDLRLALLAFDPARPVYVEAESRKIGRLHLPETLLERIRQGERLDVEASLAARVTFLLGDYDYFLRMPDLLLQRLDGLKNLHSRETFARWHELVRSADWPTLVRELLEQHYDTLYRRSQGLHFRGHRNPASFTTDDLSPHGISDLARRIVHSRTAQIA